MGQGMTGWREMGWIIGCAVCACAVSVLFLARWEGSRSSSAL